jgi:hypothetical protein
MLSASLDAREVQREDQEFVHDWRNDLACRRGGRLRFNRRRHAQRWATPILGAPASRFLKHRIIAGRLAQVSNGVAPFAG